MAGTPHDLDDIRRHWLTAGAIKLDADGLRPTARDPFLQESLETIITGHLSSGAMLLDIGCGDGLSTLVYGQHVKYVLGLDYVPALVERARESAAMAGCSAKVRFEEASALDLRAIRDRHGLFDIAVTTRCLINLATWENQQRAIDEILSCLKPDGLFITSEGWADGMLGLNLQRERAGLDPIKIADFNLMIDRTRFEEKMRECCQLEAYHSLGLYLFLSRVLQPLLTHPAPPSHAHPLNKVAAKLVKDGIGQEAFPTCDFAGVYVWRKN